MLHTQAGPVDFENIEEEPAAAPSWPFCLGAIVATIVVGFFCQTPPSDRYLAAQTFARTSPAVIAQVGEVYKIRKQLTIPAQLATFVTGDTLYQFKVCGEKGSAHVWVRTGGENTPDAYRFTVDRVAS